MDDQLDDGGARTSEPRPFLLVESTTPWFDNARPPGRCQHWPSATLERHATIGRATSLRLRAERLG
jgi:hypothetical protein